MINTHAYRQTRIDIMQFVTSQIIPTMLHMAK